MKAGKKQRQAGPDTRPIEYVHPRKTAPIPDTPRPVATNSRVKAQDKYKKDLYIGFVTNAILEKGKVPHFLLALSSPLIRDSTGKF